MVTKVMAYNIRVVNDIHHHHYQSTNGHTYTLNNNMIIPGALNMIIIFVITMEVGDDLFWIHLSVVFNCYPSCYSYFPRFKNKNIVINITEPTDYLTFSKYIFRGKAIFADNITISHVFPPFFL